MRSVQIGLIAGIILLAVVVACGEGDPEVPSRRMSVEEYIIFECETDAIPDPQTWGQLVNLSRDIGRKLDAIEPPDVLEEWHELSKDAMDLMLEIGEGKSPGANIDVSVIVANDKVIDLAEAQEAALDAMPKDLRDTIDDC